MAIKASPNPSAERVNVDIKRVARTRMIIDVGSIESPSTSHCTRSLLRFSFLRMRVSQLVSERFQSFQRFFDLLSGDFPSVKLFIRSAV
jgi:hypothetical protein